MLTSYICNCNICTDMYKHLHKYVKAICIQIHTHTYTYTYIHMYLQKHIHTQIYNDDLNKGDKHTVIKTY